MTAPAFSAPRIEFQEDGHKYFVNGELKRSWSSIAKKARLLPDFDNVPIHILANAAARGSQVDDGCSLLMEGTDFDRIMRHAHREAQPYIAAYRDFWQRHRAVGHVRVQTPLYCAKLDFCCTPDWDDLESVNDNKATAQCSRTWGLQTAAQYLAHGQAMTRRIIWLRPNLKTRKYEIHTAVEENRRIFSKLDLQVVEAACNGDYDADVIRRWRSGE